LSQLWWGRMLWHRWHWCSHRLHWGLHHHGLRNPRIAWPWHWWRRQWLTLPKTGSSRERHHWNSFAFSWTVVPRRLRAFRFSAFLGRVGPTLGAISTAPILLAFPTLIVVPSRCIHLL
jgi:hypothetical protein